MPSCDGAGMAERSYPTSEVRGGSQEDLPHSGSQGRQPGGPTPLRRPGAAARRTYPTPEARGGGREKQPHLQGAVAAQGQEGLEDLFHIQGQKGWQ